LILTAVTMKLLKLLIVLFSVLLLRCGLAVLVICASLTDKASFRGVIDRVTLIDVY